MQSLFWAACGQLQIVGSIIKKGVKLNKGSQQQTVLRWEGTVPYQKENETNNLSGIHTKY